MASEVSCTAILQLHAPVPSLTPRTRWGRLQITPNLSDRSSRYRRLVTATLSVIKMAKAGGSCLQKWSKSNTWHPTRKAAMGGKRSFVGAA